MVGEAYSLPLPCISQALPSMLCFPVPLSVFIKNKYKLQCAGPSHNAAIPKPAKCT